MSAGTVGSKQVSAYLSMAPGPRHAKQNALKNASQYLITQRNMKLTTCTSLVEHCWWSGQPQEVCGLASTGGKEEAKTNKWVQSHTCMCEIYTAILLEKRIVTLTGGAFFPVVCLHSLTLTWPFRWWWGLGPRECPHKCSSASGSKETLPDEGL